MTTKKPFSHKVNSITLSIFLFTLFFIASPTPVIGDEDVAWVVDNLTTWADAHYGITNGGDGKIHTITVLGDVTIPPTESLANTFRNVKDITVIMQGTGTISASGEGYLLRIGNGQTVIVKDLTLQGRDNTVSLVYVQTGGTFRMEGGARITGNTVRSSSNDISAGGVRVIGGTFIMQDEAAVSGNTVITDGLNKEAQGGGVYLSGGSFIMRDNAMVVGNTASISFSGNNAKGGGVYVSRGTFTMEGGSVYNNTVSGGSYGNANGGGVYINDGTFTIQNGTISSNTVTGNERAFGGGVYVGGGTFTIQDGIISGNTVRVNNAIGSGYVQAGGGGVAGRTTMLGGTISGNTVIAGRTYGSDMVYAMGGGVYGTLNMQDGIISGNTVSASNAGSSRNVTVNGGGVYFTSSSSTKTGGAIYSNYAPIDLRNTAVGGQGHAVYCSRFGVADSWRNANAGPTDINTRLDFWLDEKDITYSVTANGSPITSFTFVFSEDPGNLLASDITLSEDVSRMNATLTGSGNMRTLSPIIVRGNGIVNVSIPSAYRVDTGFSNIYLIPVTPTGITTEASASTVRLNWNPVFLAAGYRVYRGANASGTFTHIATIPSNSYTNIELPKNTSFFYRISAYNSAGESAQSDINSAATLEDNTALAIPASSDSIVVEWPSNGSLDIAKRITNAALETAAFLSIGSSDIFNFSTSYRIYRDGLFVREIGIPTRLTPTIAPPFFAPVQDSSLLNHYFVDTGLTPGSSYNYRVTVKFFAELGILELPFSSEDDVMNATATTWPQ